jgi:signal transduction histidine kinase
MRARPGRAELLVALVAAIGGAGWAALEDTSPDALAVGAMVGAALGIAHWHLRAAWLLTTAALLVAAPFGPPADLVFLVAVVGFFAGRREGRWTGVAAIGALSLAFEIGQRFSTESIVPMLLVLIAPWAAGRALGEREVIAARLAERMRELDEEREAHAALSVRYERARIASELHDIVAHAISVMVVQAAAGQRLAAHDPEATAETFETIAGAARQAEQDMGRLVALLGDEAAIGPAPDLTLVEELVARAAGSGLDVTLRLEGTRDGLPAPLVQVAYRVTREGLTNALRYAAGASVCVLVDGRSQDLVVEVVNGPAVRANALAGAGTGNGIRGLRERVGEAGGTLEAGPEHDGGWRLAARLPRLAAVTPAGEGRAEVHPPV